MTQARTKRLALNRIPFFGESHPMTTLHHTRPSFPRLPGSSIPDSSDHFARTACMYSVGVHCSYFLKMRLNDDLELNPQSRAIAMSV